MPSSSRSDAQVWPDLAEFRSLARPGRLVPVCREVLADLETPVSAFLKIHRGPYGFLLESVQGGERWGRYSFLGTEPSLLLWVNGRTVRTQVPGEPATTTQTDDPLGTLHDLLSRYEPVRLPGLPRFVGGAVGFLGYDVVRHFERLPERVASDLPVPDAVLLVPSSVVAFDNVAQKLTVITHVRVDEDTDVVAAYRAATGRLDDILARLDAPVPRAAGDGAATAEVRANVTPQAYQESVRRAKEYIRAGDVIQVVLSRSNSSVKGRNRPPGWAPGGNGAFPSCTVRFLCAINVELMATSPVMTTV
jgi:anthranilate synthase component 1